MDFQTLGNEWETVAIDRSLRGLSSDHTCVCVCVCVCLLTLLQLEQTQITQSKLPVIRFTQTAYDPNEHSWPNIIRVFMIIVSTL